MCRFLSKDYIEIYLISKKLSFLFEIDFSRGCSILADFIFSYILADFCPLKSNNSWIGNFFKSLRPFHKYFPKVCGLLRSVPNYGIAPAFLCTTVKILKLSLLFKGTVSRDGYFFKGLNILIRTFCVYALMVFTVF
jgi:hypothetical protein